jgi:hypothetical protein
VPPRLADESKARDLQPRSDSLQYGGDAFGAASELLRRFAPWEVAGARPERAAVLGGIAGALRLLASLPTLRVALSDTPAGDRLRAHFNHRICGIRHACLAQGVLVLPEEEGLYLRGRSRRAVRTGINKARAAGITCRPLEEADQRRATAWSLRARAPGMWEQTDGLLRLPGDVWWAAFAPDGEPVTIAQMVVDRDLALLQTFVSTDRASRYLLHTELVEALTRAKVRYLAVKGEIAPLMDPNVQYWQRLLGYRVANLRMLRTPLPAEEPEPRCRHRRGHRQDPLAGLAGVAGEHQLQRMLE